MNQSGYVPRKFTIKNMLLVKMEATEQSLGNSYSGTRTGLVPPDSRLAGFSKMKDSETRKLNAI